MSNRSLVTSSRLNLILSGFYGIKRFWQVGGMALPVFTSIVASSSSGSASASIFFFFSSSALSLSSTI
jgi:NAD/NADP transhydrogenase beta subunit